MGSETGAKWVGIIFIYFVVLTFVVTLIGLASPETVTTTGDTEVGTYCVDERTIYEQYTRYPLTKEEILESSREDQKFYESHLVCGRSMGVINQDICESIDGCTWTDTTFFWFFGNDEETCTGTIDYGISTRIVPLFRGDSIPTYTNSEGDLSDDICDHPDVKYNQTICEALSCNYIYNSGEINTYEMSESKPWNVVKDIASFRFDFGTGSDLADGVLTFFIFILPLFGLGLAIYVMVRS